VSAPPRLRPRCSRRWPIGLVPAIFALACPGAPPDDPPGPGSLEGPPLDGEFRPEDPRWKRVMTAESSDGLHWTPRGEALAHSASSPQLVRLDGDLRVYFVDHGRSIAWVPFDGGSVSPVSIQGLEGGLQVDPCIVPAVDGGLRMYLVHQVADSDPGLAGKNRILSAHSDSGERWTLEPGVRIEGAWVDPDVVALPDGELRMYLTQSTREVASARSDDGLDFRVEPGLRFEAGGVTSTFLTDQGWWMYFHESGVLGRASSANPERFDLPERLILAAPEGGQWMLESPSVLMDGDRWLMTYVVAPTELGQVDWDVSPPSE